MKKTFLILVLFINLSCSSIYNVKVVGLENWNESELCHIYVKNLKQLDSIVYELPTYKDDSLYVHLKKISLGDEVKIKLLKKQSLRMTKINSKKDVFYTDLFNNKYLIINGYYSPDIEGLYYVKLR
jgi:hypothetical protein